MNCRGDCASDSSLYSSFRQMHTPSAQENLTQLEIALQPLKNLVRLCITCANRMQELANYSVGIRGELSKTLRLSNQDLEVCRRLSGQVEKTIPSVVRVMGLAYLWLADSLDEDTSVANIQLPTPKPQNPKTPNYAER